MKKLFTVLALSTMFGASVQIASAAEAVSGFLYKNAQEPQTSASSAVATRVGCATCTSYMGLVALGNCSQEQAMKNGKIKTLSYVDVSTKNILGYKKVTVRAFGQ